MENCSNRLEVSILKSSLFRTKFAKRTSLWVIHVEDQPPVMFIFFLQYVYVSEQHVLHCQSCFQNKASNHVRRTLWFEIKQKITYTCSSITLRTYSWKSYWQQSNQLGFNEKHVFITNEFFLALCIWQLYEIKMFINVKMF